MARIAACQLPEVRGDVRQSLRWIERFSAVASEAEVSLVVFPEGFLQGYFTEAREVYDHALDCRSVVFKNVLRELAGIAPMLVIGMLECDGKRLFNSAVVINRGELVGVYRKTHLVGSEADIFEPGVEYPVFDVDDLRFGINICYDTNFPEAAAAVAAQGASVIVCPANNMLRRDNAQRWKQLHNKVRLQRVRETGQWLISADVTGASETRIGYGPTAVLHPSGRVLAQVPILGVGMVVADIAADGVGSASVQSFPMMSDGFAAG